MTLYIPPESLDFSFDRTYVPPAGDHIIHRLYNDWTSTWSTPWQFNLVAGGEITLKGTIDLPVNLMGILTARDLAGFMRFNTGSSESNLAVTISGEWAYSDLGVQVTPKVLYSLTQVSTKDGYTYATTNEGLVVYDTTSNLRIANRYVDGHLPTYVHCSDKYLYIGTSNGLYYVTLTDFTEDFNNCLIHKSSLIDSIEILHIHGQGEDLLIATTSGIEYLRLSKNPNIKSTTAITGVEKCFLVGDKGYYISKHIVGGITKYSLHRVDSLLCDWVTPSYSYNTGDGIFDSDIELSDMFITEGTAVLGGNTIFCTTNSGAYVIDEDNKNFALYTTR